jgi:hypothetical protein
MTKAVARAGLALTVASVGAAVVITMFNQTPDARAFPSIPAATSSTTVYRDSDGDGIPDNRDLYPYDSDNDGLPNYRDPYPHDGDVDHNGIPDGPQLEPAKPPRLTPPKRTPPPPPKYTPPPPPKHTPTSTYAPPSKHY